MVRTAAAVKADTLAKDQIGREIPLLKVSVQPTEFFQQGEDTVQRILPLGRYLLAETKSADGIRMKIYDQTGNEVKSAVAVPGSEISLSDIVKACNEIQQGGKLSLNSGDRLASVDIGRVAQRLGLSANDTRALAASLKEFIEKTQRSMGASGLNGDAIPTDWLARQNFRFRPEYRYSFDQANKTLICQSGGYIRVVNLGDGKGAYSQPSRWAVEDIADGTPTSAQILKQLPSLRQLGKVDGLIPLNDQFGYSFENGLLKVKNTQTGQLVFSDAANAIRVDSKNPTTIHFVNRAGDSLCTFDAAAASGLTTKVSRVASPISGVIDKVDFDHNGNFAILHTEESGKGRIILADRETLEPIGEIHDARSEFALDADSNVIYIDSAGKLRLAQTNMAAFVAGDLTAQRQRAAEEMVNLVSSVEHFTLPSIPRTTQAAPTLANGIRVMVEKTQETLVKKISPSIMLADSLTKLAEIGAQIEQAKKSDKFANCPEAFEGVDRILRTRIDQVRVKSLRQTLKAFKDELSEIDTPTELVRLDWRHAEIQKQRREMVISDPAERSRVETEMKEVAREVELKHSILRTELAKKLSTQFEEVQKIVADVQTLGELNAAEGDAQTLSFHALISYVRDVKEKQCWREKYRTLIGDKRTQIEEQVRREAEVEVGRLAAAVEECQETELEIDREIAKLGSKEDLIIFKRTNAMMLKFEAKLQALPDDLRKIEETRLERIFTRREKDFVAKVQMQTENNGKVVTFGKESFPVFQVERVVWQPKVLPVPGTQARGKLVFRSNIAGDFEPEAELVPFDLTNAETAKAIDQHKGEAQAYFAQLERKVPKWNDRWVVNEFVKSKLDKLAEKFRIQLEEQPHLTIVESEAGAGKDVDLEMFAYFTNREIVEIPCSSETDKEEVVLDFSFDPKKGTGYVPSKLIETLSRPGVIILFNEINTLQDGVAHTFNTLFDSKRKLILRDGREVKAHPTTIFVGLINPQDYIGVKPLPEVIKSRSRVIRTGFPPEKSSDNKRYTPFEAEIMSKYVSELETLSQADFYKLWDYCVNGEHSNGGDKLATRERSDKVMQLHEIVKISNMLREGYQQYRRGNSTEVISYCVGLRDTIGATTELKRAGNAKAALKEIVLGKIGDRAERESVERLIGK